MTDAAPRRAAKVKQPERPKLSEIMGPGLITGASDDDPSGIATYSLFAVRTCETDFGFHLEEGFGLIAVT